MDQTEPATGLQPGSQTPEITAPTMPALPSQEFHKLDQNVVRMWKISALIGNGLLLLGALVGGTALWIFARFPPLVIVPAWLGFALMFVLETLWLPRKRYEATCYRMGEGFLEFRSGLLWKTSVMIPISRLQHIDLLRGPWEQHYGLATLDLHTAGTSKASHKISGLELGTATRIREQLIAAADVEWLDSAAAGGQG